MLVKGATELHNAGEVQSQTLAEMQNVYAEAPQNVQLSERILTLLSQ